MDRMPGEVTLCGGVQSLISDCWEGEPSKRPSAKDVISRLQEMEHAIQYMESTNKRGVVDSYPEKDSPTGGTSCCVIS